MTEDEQARIAAIQARAQAATPTDGPLARFTRYDHGGARLFIDGEAGQRNLIADFYEENDREFYYHARADIPWLLAELSSLQADRDKAIREKSDARLEQGKEQTLRAIAEAARDEAQRAIAELKLK